MGAPSGAVRWSLDGDTAVGTTLSLVGFGALAALLGMELLGIGSRGIGLPQLALALAAYAALLYRDWRQSASATRTQEAIRHLTIAAEVGALTLVIAMWSLEGPGLYERIAPLAFLGFLLHHALPARLRPGFFLLLSLAGIGATLGAQNGALLLGIGLVLIGTCHLPVAFGARVALVAALGGVLAAVRVGLVPVTLPLVVWPVLASMFMFRLIAYLYDLRHGNAPKDIAQRLSYFFMLPSVVFPLFPVVDANTYHRRYYDADVIETYQRGAGWMLRGVLHLIIYRFIYQRLTLAPEEVATTAQLAQYMLTTFGLYLRVSGQFHLIVGLMQLFGHRLPETHKAYFLASSFTELWRRINIYWKDFIQKVVFFPVFFRVRGRGELFALVVATMVAFFGTWFFHSYQWFWILGKPLVSAPDILFWSVLALLVLIDSLRERKQGRIRKLGDRGFSLKEAFSLGLRTAMTFLTLTVLWTIWTSGTTEEWVSLLSVVDLRDPGFYLMLAGYFGLAVLIAATTRYFSNSTLRLGDAGGGHFGRQVGLTFAGVGLLMVVPQQAFSSRLTLEHQVVLRDLRRGELSQRDAERMKRGYYESLIGVNALNSQLWEVYSKRPDDWQVIADTPAGRNTGDFLEKALVPNASILFHGAPFRVNRWGMRDRDYEKVPPPDTRRIAVFGASYTLGSGVGDGENWESLIEERLNRERAPGAPAVEILNFAAPGYTALQHLYLMDQRALEFKPDVLWLVAYNDEALDLRTHLAKAVRAGAEIPYEYLRDIVRKAGVTADLSEEEATRRLHPYHMEMLEWTYREVIERCKARGIHPVWVYLPATRVPKAEEPLGRMLPIATRAGFDTVELATVYDGHRLEDIVVAAYDFHPNQKGHRIIADRLYEQLRSRPELVVGPGPGR